MKSDTIPNPRRWVLRVPLLTRSIASFCAISLYCVSLVAQIDTSPKPPATAPHEAPVPELRVSVAAKQVEAKAELATAENDLAAAAEDTPEKATLRNRAEFLRRLDSTLAQQVSMLERLEQLNAANQQADEQLNRIRTTGVEGDRPYSFLRLERLRDEKAAREARRVALTNVLKAAVDALEQARVERTTLERELRAIQESIATAAEDAKPALRPQQVVAELRLRVARQGFMLRGLDLRAERLAEQVFEKEVAAIDERLAIVSKDVAFSADDLRSVLTEVEKEELRIRSRQRRLELERNLTSGFRPGASPEQAELERAIRENSGRETASLGAQLERLTKARELWDQRYRTANDTADRAEMRTWQTTAKEAIDQLELEKSLLQARREALDGEITSAQERSQNATEAGTRTTLETLLGALQDRERIQKENAASIHRLESLYQKLLVDLAPHVATFSWGERLSDVWSAVVSVWTFQVFSVDERAITVGKILIGLFLLSIGFTVSRWGSMFLGRRLLPRLGLNEGAAGAVQSVSFYLLMLTFALFALRVAEVPLTVFTLLGGAVAIGIGFGSQNIMNNFISGLILLAERPVRVGDVIQVGDLYGNVERIGPRSTRVTTGDNLEIIVPNSSFLESNVINWTLSNKQVRSSVKVGVAYGSPTRDVAKLLMKAAEEHGKVQKRPPPFVLFDDFGNDSLAFELYFWTEIRTIMNVRMLKSDLRFRIDHLFQEAGIVIAFPQRDVHFDTAQPIPVRMVEPSAPDDSGLGVESRTSVRGE